MFVTVPTMPPISTRSPIFSGRSTSSMIPLIRFFSRFCAPKPNAIASAPPRNANTVSGILTRSSASTNSTAISMIWSHRRAMRATFGSALNRATSWRSSRRTSHALRM